MRSPYEKLNPWSQTNTKETFGKKNCLNEGDKWTEGVSRKVRMCYNVSRYIVNVNPSISSMSRKIKMSYNLERKEYVYKNLE
jgi:hypothetical protein